MDLIASLNGLPGVIAIAVILTVIFGMITKHTSEAFTKMFDLLRSEVHDAKQRGDTERTELKLEIKDLRNNQMEMIFQLVKEINTKFDTLLMNSEPPKYDNKKDI